MDTIVIWKVIQTLIGETEPYGDSAIDKGRMENLTQLICIVDMLLCDIEKVAICKDRCEGSMRMMGEKAHKALNDWRSCIDAYLMKE